MNYKKLLYTSAAVLSLWGAGVIAQSQTVSAAEQQVSGSYVYENKETILNRLNQIRKEAYDEGLVDRYVPVKWSQELEKIAELRSVEASVLLAHSRPNGESDPFGIRMDGIRTFGENLAWNNTGVMEGIDFFYSEKEAYIKAKVNKQSLSVGEQYGHYENLIRPEFEYTALVAFKGNNGTITAQSFANVSWLAAEGLSTNLTEDQRGLDGATTVTIDMGGSSSSSNGTAIQPTTAKKDATASEKAVENGWSGRSYYENGEKVYSRWIYDANYSSWFYIDSEGNYLENTWVKDYYLKSGGYMSTSEWVYDSRDNSWYYTRYNGVYAKNMWIGDYYVDQNGRMAKNTWVDGYYVGDNGRWVR